MATWSEPSETTTPHAAEALTQILDDHVRIRQLLQAAIGVAERAEQGRWPATAVLRHLVTQVGTTLERHLAVEESLILPLLEDDLPVGPQRARMMREEHRRQREEIADLLAGIEGLEVKRIGERLEDLARAFLVDMEHEERELLRPDVVRDDLVVIDQSCG